MKNNVLRLSAALALFCGTAAASARPSALTVRVDGVRGDWGQIMICLVAPGGDWLQPQMKPAGPEGVSFDFTGLTERKTEIMVFHDENGNYTLDRLPDGTPAEGCATKKCRLSPRKSSETVTLWYGAAPGDDRPTRANLE